MSQPALKVIEEEGMISRKNWIAAIGPRSTVRSDKGPINCASADENAVKTKAISTGYNWPEIALGIGGLPRGRVAEILSGPGVGKPPWPLIGGRAQKAGPGIAPSSMPACPRPALCRQAGRSNLEEC